MFDEEPAMIPARRVTAVDSVGAGDAFNGALAAAVSERRGTGLAAGVAWANAAAALAVTRRRGPTGSFAWREEIDRLVGSVVIPA